MMFDQQENSLPDSIEPSHYNEDGLQLNITQSDGGNPRATLKQHISTTFTQLRQFDSLPEEFRIVGPGFDIRGEAWSSNWVYCKHFIVGDEGHGIGSLLIDELKTTTVETNRDTLLLWIGTGRHNQQETRVESFLQKHEFCYTRSYDEAHGLTFEAEWTVTS